MDLIFTVYISLLFIWSLAIVGLMDVCMYVRR